MPNLSQIYGETRFFSEIARLLSETKLLLSNLLIVNLIIHVLEIYSIRETTCKIPTSKNVLVDEFQLLHLNKFLRIVLSSSCSEIYDFRERLGMIAHKYHISLARLYRALCHKCSPLCSAESALAASDSLIVSLQMTHATLCLPKSYSAVVYAKVSIITGG